MTTTQTPKLVLLFSGKRKSGKDFITEELVKSIKVVCDVVVIKISAPIKSHFASTYNLEIDSLMGDGEYKERYRTDMIKWSDLERLKDPGIFCRQAVKMYNAENKTVWIVSDIRRKTDIAWFQTMYGAVVKTVRISANEETRSGRGFVFTSGVDNVTSECDLDDIHDWDLTFDNSNGSDVPDFIDQIMNLVRTAISP